MWWPPVRQGRDLQPASWHVRIALNEVPPLGQPRRVADRVEQLHAHRHAVVGGEHCTRAAPSCYSTANRSTSLGSQRGSNDTAAPRTSSGTPPSAGRWARSRTVCAIPVTNARPRSVGSSCASSRSGSRLTKVTIAGLSRRADRSRGANPTGAGRRPQRRTRPTSAQAAGSTAAAANALSTSPNRNGNTPRSSPRRRPTCWLAISQGSPKA